MVVPLYGDGSDDMTAATPDRLGAFMPDGRFEIEPNAEGPLSGTTFAAKDLIDVRGHTTSAGNPTWAREAGIATDHAPVVATLLDSGATLVGKTVLDEMAFGVAGINAHYGTPINPAAPGRLAGGSSCGSAVAVAGKLCDFALGTDTGGSVRIPASYCGVFGIRPSHAAVPIEGVVQLAPSLDTVGWFARDPVLFESVGDVLLPADDPEIQPIERVIVATDAVETLGPDASEAFGDLRQRLEALLGRFGEIELAGADGDLTSLQAAYRAVQGREASRLHQTWIDAHPDALGPMAKERFRVAASATDAVVAAGQARFTAYASWLTEVLRAGTVICLPTVPGPAPRVDGDPSVLAAERLATLSLTTAASGTGVPQISLPLLEVGGLPIGVSFIAARGSDRALLAFGSQVSKMLAAAPGGGDA